jgi:hypothetical protein
VNCILLRDDCSCYCLCYVLRIYVYMIYTTQAGMCIETHGPVGANGLGVRPPKHSMASKSAGPQLTSDALSQFFWDAARGLSSFW